jgi:hypothetical protein
MEISRGTLRVINKNRKNDTLTPVKQSHIIEEILHRSNLYNKGNNKINPKSKNDNTVSKGYP